MPEFELSGTTRAMPLPVWAAKKVASTRKRLGGEAERRRRRDAAAVLRLGGLAVEEVVGGHGVVAHRLAAAVERDVARGHRDAGDRGRAGEGDAEEREGLVAARRRHLVAPERLAVDAEVLDRRAPGEVDVGEDRAEAGDHRRPVGAGDEELHLVGRVAERGEEALGRERRELRGVGRIEIREDDRRRGRIAGLGAHREEVAGAVEEDGAARRGEVEEVGRQQIRPAGAVGDAVPVDLAAQAAERAVRSGDRAAAEVGPEGVARGGDRGQVPGGGADDLGLRGRAREERRADECGEEKALTSGLHWRRLPWKSGGRIAAAPWQDPALAAHARTTGSRSGRRPHFRQVAARIGRRRRGMLGSAARCLRGHR